MALPLSVELELDRRSATALANEVEQAMSQAGRNITRDFNRSMSGLGLSLRDEIRGGVNQAVGGATSQFGALGRVAESTFSGMSSKAALGAAGVAGIGVAAVAVGKQLYDLGAEWDSIADGITMRTGKIGSELTALTDAVGDVGSTTAASLGSIGEIVGQLAQSMPELAANNTALRAMASNLAYLDANGQAINIRELGKAFVAFNVNAADQVRTLDNLSRVSRDTGIPINQLINTVQRGAPQFKQFGMDMSESTGLLAVFEDAGLDAASASTGLRRALASIAGDDPAKGLAEVVTQIKALNDAGQSGAARDLASETFGTRNFAPFLDAITTGRLAVDGLNKSLDDTGLSLQDMQDQTDDGAQGWEKLTNTIKTEFGPHASNFFSMINSQIQYMTGHLSEAKTELQELASTPITPDSALGQMLLPAGGPAGAGGNGPALNWGSSPTGDAASSSRMPFNWDGTLKFPATGPPPAAKDPTMPVVPMGGDPMSLLQGFSPTSSLYGAAQGVLGAQHDQAQAQAELNALEASNTATAEEIQAAKNKIFEADQSAQQAEMRLNEAKQSATEKFTKQMDTAVGALDEFGAGLDKDLGISKGLAGMADNLVRFLGSIAAAPLMGQLNAMSQAQGGIGKTGSGLMGMLAQQGAFGEQYTPAAIAAAEAAASGGGYGGSGYGGSGYSTGGYGQTAVPAGVASTPAGFDAALLSRVPRGVGEYDNATKDLSQGLVDCASGVEDLVNIMDGKSTAGGSLWTGNASTVLPEMGFLPGMGGPGDFRVGYNSGHMQATLPGGTNVNFGSTEAIQAGGLDGGAGAFDPSFTEHYYRPVSGPPIGGAPPRAPASTPSAPSTPATGIYSPENTNPGLNNPVGPTTPAAPGGRPYNAVGAPDANGEYAELPKQGTNGWTFNQSTGKWRPPANAPTTPPPGSSYGSSAPTAPKRSPASGLPAPGSTGLPWENMFTYDTGGPLPPGTTVVQNNTGKPETVVNPQGMVGNQHVSSMFPGPGPGNAPGNPGGGNAAAAIGQQGPTAIGGADKKAVPGGGASAGAGALGMATSAAAMAADAFAPGSGQAVQVAGKLAERAIRFGGQLAGVGVQGLMETFLPTGGSELANNNWLMRIGGAFAGASPQLPNVAGKPPTPVPPLQQAAPAQFPTTPGGQQGGDQRPININLNGVGNVDQTSLNHFTGDISRAVNMPGMGR